jgi:hypothetical protein
MKRSSNKRDHVVVRFNEYDNTWRDLTTPATFLQAVRWVAWHSYKNFVDQGIMKIVTLEEFAKLQQKETA